MYFCIRDDDTCYFTTPEALESAYDGIHGGPVSLAVIPYCRAGASGFIPERYQRRWTVHPLHENNALVQYLRRTAAEGRYEIMLHGFHHDQPDGHSEFGKPRSEPDLIQRVVDGRKYLEDLIGAPVRMFVPPSNGLSRMGLAAIVRGGLQLGGAAGVRGGWKWTSIRTWSTWKRLRQWHAGGGLGVPWILDMGDHREILGNPVTPSSRLADNEAIFRSIQSQNGAFCAATHYWEFSASSSHAGDPNVGGQLRRIVELARDRSVLWRSVGDTVVESRPLF